MPARTSMARLISQVDIPSSGAVRMPPMLRCAYVDSTPHLEPGGTHANLHFGGVVTSAFAMRVAWRVGFDPEKEPRNDLDSLKLTIARAIINDPDIVVVNAENMPRGKWLRPCLEALCAWQAGEFGDEANSSLFWKELGEVERQRTLVISGSLEDLQAETLECVQNAEPPVHKLYIESPSSIAILSRENERMKERVYDI